MAGQRQSPAFELTGIEEVVAKLNQVVSRIEKEAVPKAIERIATHVVNEAKQFCPVDTGRLRSSLAYEMRHDSSVVYALVGTYVEYGPYVEFGTLYAAAQPFLRPALQRAMAQMMGETLDVIRHEIPALQH